MSKEPFRTPFTRGLQIRDKRVTIRTFFFWECGVGFWSRKYNKIILILIYFVSGWHLQFIFLWRFDDEWKARDNPWTYNYKDSIYLWQIACKMYSFVAIYITFLFSECTWVSTFSQVMQTGFTYWRTRHIFKRRLCIHLGLMYLV